MKGRQHGRTKIVSAWSEMSLHEHLQASMLIYRACTSAPATFCTSSPSPVISEFMRLPSTTDILPDHPAVPRARDLLFPVTPPLGGEGRRSYM